MGWVLLAVVMFFALAPSAEERERANRWMKWADEIERKHAKELEPK